MGIDNIFILKILQLNSKKIEKIIDIQSFSNYNNVNSYINNYNLILKPYKITNTKKYYELIWK